jgi:hypothetical protein
MKTAVVTLSIACDHNNCWMEAGLPSKRRYAKNIGADFINITDRKYHISVAAEKYQIGEMLGEYERVFYLDADLTIDPSAPNIFDVVPVDHFGCYDEGRPALYAWLKEGWPDDPCEFYCNNGVFVCSREHQWLFDWRTLNRRLNTYEQTHMSRRIWEATKANPPRIRVHWLPQNWNFMPHLWVGNVDSPKNGWLLQEPPDPCYIHHYPCHNPEERTAAMTALNRRYSVA